MGGIISIKKEYKFTLYACYLGYIVQGIINNINPILFIYYKRELGISLDKIGILIAANFCIQILVDLLSAKYVDKIGYRKSMVLAHGISVIGLFGIGTFPLIFSDPFIGLMLATALNGIGGGLLEVLVSPIVEAVPTKEKDKAMSLLHSFYCWGCVGFIAISTIILRVIGTEHWHFLPLVWTFLPLINCLLFSMVPINTLVEKEEEISIRKFMGQKVFWYLVLLMCCAGASEMGMSQWASYFAQIGLNVNKTVGDLLGPGSFCFLMGVVRLYYGKSGDKISLESFMKRSCILCVFSYLLAVFAPHPFLGLLGCALCGLSVGILWPGTFSIAAKEFKAGGTAIFAILALAGDVGCVSGPEVVSSVTKFFPQYGIKAGLLAAIIFPICAIFLLMHKKKKA